MSQTNAEQTTRTLKVTECAIRATDHYSGRHYPPLATRGAVIGALARGGRSLEECHDVILDARSRGEIFQTKTDEQVYFGINDEATLLEKIRSYLEHTDDPKADVIGLANEQIRALRESE